MRVQKRVVRPSECRSIDEANLLMGIGRCLVAPQTAGAGWMFDEILEAKTLRCQLR
jgi:hypothetical protein